MKERILDNVLMMLTMALLLMAFAVAVIGVIQLFVHGFNWVTLAWTVGAYVASGLMYSLISRDYITFLTWTDDARAEAS